MRLTFSAAEPAEIRTGIRILGTLLQERVPSGSGEERRERRETVPIL